MKFKLKRRKTPLRCAGISCKNHEIIAYSINLALCKNHVKLFGFVDLVKHVKVNGVVL